MPSNTGGGEIVGAIREMRPGDWDASEGEVIDGVLIMRPTTRRESCCGRDLELVAAASRGSLRWELRRCRQCERAYSLGPQLPPAWVGALAQVCIDLYQDFRSAVSDAYAGQPRAL